MFLLGCICSTSQPAGLKEKKSSKGGTEDPKNNLLGTFFLLSATFSFHQLRIFGVMGCHKTDGDALTGQTLDILSIYLCLMSQVLA